MWSRARAVLVTVVVVVPLLLGACGDDGGSAVNSPPTTAKRGAGVSVPNPCALLGRSELAAIIGSDPGQGAKQQVVPSRAVCSYSTGLIVGVSDGTQYDATVEAGRNAGYQYSDVAGVGDGAKTALIGGGDFQVVQILAVKGKYMIDVTLVNRLFDELG
jgi:hypothetical protein